MGAFILTAGVITTVIGQVQRTQGKAHRAFADVIQAGQVLRERMIKITEPMEISPPEKKPWETRIDDWLAESERVVSDFAPERLPGLRVDVIYANVTVKDSPPWVADLILSIDVRCEQLIVIRATL